MSARDSNLTTDSNNSDAPSDNSEGEIQLNLSQKPYDGEVEVIEGQYIGRKGTVIRRKSTVTGNNISHWRYTVKLNATYDKNGVIVIEQEELVVFTHDKLKPRSRL